MKLSLKYNLSECDYCGEIYCLDCANHGGWEYYCSEECEAEYLGL